MKTIKILDTATETCWMTTNDLDIAKSFIKYLLGSVSHLDTFVIWEPETGKSAPLLDMANHLNITL